MPDYDFEHPMSPLTCGEKILYGLFLVLGFSYVIGGLVGFIHLMYVIFKR